jgi:hypothetical protein
VALDKLVSANAEVKSARSAVRVLTKLTGITISESHLLNLTTTIGDELAEQRDAQGALHAAKQLPAEVEEAPRLAVVATDGGRIQTRSENAGRGVHEPKWNETKVACLMTMSSNPQEVDPHPELPRCFSDRPYVDRLVREMKSLRGEAANNVEGGTDAVDPQDAAPQGLSNKTGSDSQLELEELLARCDVQDPTAGGNRSEAWRPKRLVRTCVSSLCCSDEFGPLVAAEAQRRRFFQADRRAFLGDGLPWNWTLHKRHFSSFVPILDFVHPLTYLYEASRIVAEGDPAWNLYLRWATACWQGHASTVLEDFQSWQARHPSAPGEKLSDNDPRTIIAKTATYLRHNLSRMDYPEYRRQGLPVTSSMVESLIKELNYRVKGSEKFWKRPGGAEAILQVRTAALCDDRDRLSELILNRPGSPFYRPSTAKQHRQHTAATAA